MEDDFLGSSIQLSNEDIMRNATIIDEGIQETVTSNFLLTHAEIIKSANIIDEGIKLCPLCRNEIKLFFINFNEKFLMCENIDCVYPFGQEELTFVKENESVHEKGGSVRSRPTFGSPTETTCSIASADIDKILDSETDNRTEARDYYKHKKTYTRVKKPTIEENPEILKEVEAISKMNEAMDDTDSRCIRNEKWIKNLMALQEASGLSLLKPAEVSLVKHKEPEIGLGELKIDINTDTQQNTSMINIQISNMQMSNTNSPPKT